MTKLFLTLYLMVIASFGVFVFYVAMIFLIGENFGEGAIIEEKISKGTLLLLNESFADLNSRQAERLLKKYHVIFGDEFGLVELSSLDLDEEQVKTLNNGKIVSIETDNIYLSNETKTVEDIDKEDLDEEVTILYFKKTGTSLVWRIHLDYGIDLTVNESGLRIKIIPKHFSDGMMTLINAKLPSDKKEQWQDILNKIEPTFGMKLTLLDNHFETSIANIDDIKNIKKGKVVNINKGAKFVTLVQRIPDSTKLLQVGPIEIPWYLRNSPYLFISSFILAFATTLLLWLWPFWSNLIKIKSAAEKFGKGNYEVRITHRWWSPIAKISSAFNAMAEQTQNSIRQQKELTSAVSHELRTPVARMRFALEMLDSSDSNNDKGRFIKDINEDIDELDLLLEELLTYARFDQKSYSISPTLEKLIPWLSDSMEKLLPLAENKVLHYRVEGIGINETSLFEPRLMARVLDNLVQNALRYAHKNVEVTLSKDHDDYLLIVEDDGDGISKDKRKHIFDAFSRIDASRDRASGGFGLGLAIVDRIVKAHSGHVTVHDSPLGGARFEVRISVKDIITN